MSFFRSLGGVFLRIPRLSTAIRPGVVVLATYLVLTQRPIRDQWVWIADQVPAAWEWVTSPVPSRLLPVVVLILGLTFVGVSPIVDHVRARDEAAKDANRLLGELLGRLERLEGVFSEWRRQLHDDRWRLVAHWVERSTDEAYRWRHASGASSRWSSVSGARSVDTRKG